MAMAGFSVSQEVPFPGKLSLREDIATWEAKQEKERLWETTLNVISRLKVAYYGLYFVHQSLEIVGKDKDILEKFEKAVEIRYQTGQGIQQDVLKAQVEISRLLDRLIDLEQKRESAEAIINSLLYRSPLAPLGRPEAPKKTPLPQTLEELSTLIEENSPALKAADFMIERNKTALTLAKKEYFPDFVVKTGWFNRQTFKDFWQAGVEIKVPLYFWRKQRSGVTEATESLGEARQSRENVKQMLLAQVKDLYVTAKRAENLITLYETGIIPQATLSLDSAAAGYQVGKVDFLTYLDNFIFLLDAELRFQEELTSFEKAVAQLEETVGIELGK
jgi:outer membrane protein TolC